MASQLTSRIFATFLLVCCLRDFTSSFLLPKKVGSIISEKFSLLNPLFPSVADNRPTTFPHIVYVFVSPNERVTAATIGSMMQATSSATEEVGVPTVAPIPADATTASAPELSPTVATMTALEVQPTMAITPEPLGSANGDATESPAEIAPQVTNPNNEP